LLDVQKLSAFYGPIQALREVSLEVAAGQAVAVLGPNGAGKTTLMHSISGLVRSVTGDIRFNGADIAGKPPHVMVRMGIIQVPEGRRIFTQMTVRENLLLGAYTWDEKRNVREHLDFVYSLFPDLHEKRTQLGGELSGGQQQMLAIGRALMGRPSLLILDEPSLGLSPIMVEQVANTIEAIRKDLGTSILLVEQNAGLALELTNRVYVMQTGRVVLSGESAEVSPEEIRRAYLGNVEAATPAGA
jgi:branched-chain amino acid transport system ATP-binding protein